MGAICRHFGPHHRYEDVRSLSAAQRTSEEVRLRAGSRGDGREGTTWQEVSVPIIFGSDKVVEDSPWRSRQQKDTTFPPIPDQAPSTTTTTATLFNGLARRFRPILWRR